MGSEEFTDNVRSVSKGRQSDVLTSLTPSLYLNGDTPRFAGTLNYSPTVIEHAVATDQNQIIQNMAGNGTLTAVPELFFFDGSVQMANEDRAGGFGFGNQAQIPTNLSTQTTAYSASPYLQFHYGDTGDEEVRYQVAQTIFSGNTGPVAGPVAGTSLGPISNATQQELLAKFTTGEGFGRLKLTALNDYVDFSSTAALSSRHETADINALYNISGPYFALSEIGYERLIFQQQSPLNFSGPRWSLGGKYQPRDDRMISLTYGKTEGQYGYNGKVQYAAHAADDGSARPIRIKHRPSSSKFCKRWAIRRRRRRGRRRTPPPAARCRCKIRIRRSAGPRSIPPPGCRRRSKTRTWRCRIRTCG